MKTCWRATFVLTEDRHKDLQPSNIFFWAEGDESVAKRGVEAVYRKVLSAHGLADAAYRMELRPSSEEEAAQYAALQAAGYRTNRLIN